MWKLILLFTVVPAVEIALLIGMGIQFGPLWTVVFILLTGLLGGYFAKREGVSVLRQLVDDLQRGVPPAERLTEGALVLVGGVLLVTPGVLTDLAGLVLVLPWTRRLLAPRVLGWAARTFKVSQVRVGSPQASARPEPEPPRRTPFDHPVR